MDVDWSTLEIDMDYLGEGHPPQPGMARGCLYGDHELICPERRMMQRPWISEAYVDHTGQLGCGMDGVRVVFCEDPRRWVYNQKDFDQYHAQRN